MNEYIFFIVDQQSSISIAINHLNNGASQLSFTVIRINIIMSHVQPETPCILEGTITIINRNANFRIITQQYIYITPCHYQR